MRDAPECPSLLGGDHERCWVGTMKDAPECPSLLGGDHERCS